MSVAPLKEFLSMTKVDEETFKNNIKLRDLDLSENQLEGDFDTNSLKYLSSLQTLNLAGNVSTHMK